MNLGLFDLPAPFFGWVDAQLTRVLPLPLSLALWAVGAAILSMELYRLTSPQARLGAVKDEVQRLQQNLNTFDGPFEQAWPLLSRLLKLSFKRVGMVTPATLLSAYPVIALLLWMNNTYSHRFPGDDEVVVVEVAPPFAGQLQSGSPPHLRLWQEGGEFEWEQVLMAPIPELQKRGWWHSLSANPAGYLPASAPLDSVALALPRREFIHAGPDWLRGWQSIVIVVLLIAALSYKTWRKIQ